MVKHYVEKMNDPNRQGAAKRTYELKDVEKVAVTANGVLSAKGGLTEAATTTDISVADLFDAVKR